MDETVAKRTSILDRPSDFQGLAAQLCSNDPLGRLLVTLSQQSPWRVVFLAAGAYAVMCLGAGTVISVLYERAGREFFGILDLRELPVALFVYLVAAPIIWALYGRQPWWILQIFEGLSESGVLIEPERGTTLCGFVQQAVNARASKVRYVVAAAFVGLGGVLVPVATAYGPYYRYFFGFPTSWWLINPVYFWVIWVPMVLFLPLYMVASLVVRQVVTVHALGRLFRQFDVEPRLFQPDRCNGFASVGNYAIRSGLAGLFFLLWLAIMISYPTFFKEPMRLDYTTLLPLAIYPVALPVLLLPPVMGAHTAMSKAKARALEAVAIRLRAVLSEREAECIRTSMSLAGELERKYRLMDREYRTWPFYAPTLRRLGLATVLTTVPTLVSIARDVYLLAIRAD